MKPFDLGAAKRGEPIFLEGQCTGWNYSGPVFFVGVSENGIPVVEIGSKPVRASPEYLRMAPKKRTVYINLHKQRDTGEIMPFLYDDEAYANRQRGHSMNCLGTFPIEIED
jgi:hypothetical protein